MGLPPEVADLAEKLHQRLIDASSKCRRHKGRVSLQPTNEGVDRILLVRSGIVARYKIGEQGPCIIALRYAGEAFYPHERSMDSGIITLVPSTTLEGDGAVMREALRDCPGLCNLYQQSLQRNEQIAYEWLFRNQMKARARVAHFLCEYADRSAAATDKPIVLPLFQRQIGAIIGIHLMQVNRSFKSLEQDGILYSVGIRTFRIDWTALRDVGKYTGNYWLQLSRRAGN